MGIAGNADGKIEINPFETNYPIGEVDLKLVPKVSGSVVVTIPVWDKVFTEHPLFEQELDPFWENKWSSKLDYSRFAGEYKAVNSSDLSIKYSNIILNDDGSLTFKDHNYTTATPSSVAINGNGSYLITLPDANWYYIYPAGADSSNLSFGGEKLKGQTHLVMGHISDSEHILGSEAYGKVDSSV